MEKMTMWLQSDDDDSAAGGLEEILESGGVYEE